MTVAVPGRPSILYVEGNRAQQGYLASALNAQGFEVDPRGPSELPSSLRELERYDFVILSDTAREAVSLEAHAKRVLGVDFHGTTPDGAIRLEPVYCLGNCALGPSIMIDEELNGRVTARRFDELMSACRAAPEAVR